MNQVTKKQHYVPVFYLSRFTNPRGFLEVLDLKRRNILKPRSCGGVGYGKYFYSLETGVADDLGQLYEKCFSDLENKISKEWDQIIYNARNKKLTLSDLRWISCFVAMQWIRTPYFRDQINSGELELRKMIHDLDIKSKDSVGRVERGELCDIPKINNAGHLNFISEHLIGFENLFFNKQWNVFIAPRNAQFITTDNPVAEWQKGNKSIFGTNFLSRKHYFALSPKILIEFAFPTRDYLKMGPEETVTYKNISKDTVLMYDLVLVGRGYDHAFAQGKKEFTEIIRQIKKLGKAKDLYLKNFYN